MDMSTQGRALRSRAASAVPLPTVLNPSTAYGSRASTPLASQGKGRRGAASRQQRESSAESSARSAAAKPAPKRKTRAPQPAIAEEDEDAEEQQQSQPQPAAGQGPFSIQGTAIESQVGYDHSRLLALERALAAATAAGTNLQQHEATNDEELEMLARPWDITVCFLSVLSYLERLLNFVKMVITSAPLLLFFLLVTSTVVGFFTIPGLPPSWESRRDRMTRGARIAVGLPQWEQPPAGLEKEWIYFKHWRLFRPDELPDHNVPDLQWTININYAERIGKLEAKTDKLAEALEGVQSTISNLLPRLVVVDVVDKHLHITEEFYTALHQKLHGDDAFWSAFLEKNQQTIDDMENSRLDRYFDTASKSQDIVSARTALEMIQDDNQRQLEFFAKNTREERESFIKDVRDIAEEAVVDALGRNSGGTLPTGDLSKHHFIENTLLEMQNLNFFSPKSGAVPVREFTSPSAVKPQPNAMARIWAWAMYPPNSPVTALKQWAEFRDAWCATESTNKGKAQLGVKTKYSVAPRELVVEHIPASGSLSIRTAPRDVELWMDAGSVEEAAHIQRLIAAQSPRYKGFGGCGEAPGDGFVCVARGRYDIHGENWVQKIPTFIDMESWSFHESNMFVARVTTNWGGDTTCLYRLRLHGMTRGEQ